VTINKQTILLSATKANKQTILSSDSKASKQAILSSDSKVSKYIYQVTVNKQANNFKHTHLKINRAQTLHHLQFLCLTHPLNKTRDTKKPACKSKR
jgi:hypothetical protein